MTVQLPSHAVHADGGVSVQEAATLLGCSEKTIRRRIKAGSLTAYRLPTSQGYEWRVQLDSPVDQVSPRDAVQLNGPAWELPGTADQVDTQTSRLQEAQEPEPVNEALLRALGLVDRLQRENMELAGRVGFLQAKLQSAEERILALSSGEPSQEPVPAAAASAPPWQRFFAWLRAS
jgi:excisionase family DNA binding protein